MKKVVKLAVIAIAVAFLAIQFFQIDKANPPINESETLEAAVKVPPDVTIILGRSCNDCHTNKTVYPWYAYVQPAGWFLRSHIDDGKRHLNFSIFATYDAKKKAKKLEEICEQVTSAEMPLPSYTWIHRDAVLTGSEREALCAWADGARALLSAPAAP